MTNPSTNNVLSSSLTGSKYEFLSPSSSPFVSSAKTQCQGKSVTLGVLQNGESEKGKKLCLDQ
eukprot:Awhi_evm1s1088